MEGLNPLVQAHMATTGKSIDEIRSSIAKISEALTTLVRLETEQRAHASALEKNSDDLGDHDKRLKAIEIVIPVLRQTHGWVVAAALGIIALVGVQVFQFVTARAAPNFPAISQPAGRQ